MSNCKFWSARINDDSDQWLTLINLGQTILNLWLYLFYYYRKNSNATMKMIKIRFFMCFEQGWSIDKCGSCRDFYEWFEGVHNLPWGILHTLPSICHELSRSNVLSCCCFSWTLCRSSLFCVLRFVLFWARPHDSRKDQFLTPVTIKQQYYDSSLTGVQIWRLLLLWGLAKNNAKCKTQNAKQTWLTYGHSTVILWAAH